MFTIIVQALGWLGFTAGLIFLGAWLRRNPSKPNAERTSRIGHSLFWIGIVAPALLGIFYPGLTRFDAVVGLSPLPQHALLFAAGALSLLAGVCLLVVSSLALSRLGEGANAFWLTKRVVIGDIYRHVRNPMSLGYYLTSLGIALLAGSSYLVVGALLAVVPAHILYLRYFEEYELELRLGQSYAEYKRTVPFLLPRLTRRAT